MVAIIGPMTMADDLSPAAPGQRGAARIIGPAFSWRRPAAVPFLGLLLGAFFLRVFLLGKQSIWFDEAITLNLATASWPEIVADRADNIHPPLYFFLMKAWVDLLGVSPFISRYSSVLASFLQVPAVFLLGRIWLGRRTAWLAALLVALSPLSVIYAQEMRVYALLPLIYLALLLLAHLLAGPRAADRRTWFLLALVEAVALHLHYVAAFAVAYVALWLLWRLWRREGARRRWLLAQLGAGVAALPWVVTVLSTWWVGRGQGVLGFALPTKPIARAFTEPVPRIYLLRQLWTFLLTGMAGILDRTPVFLLSSAGALLILLLFLHRLRSPARRGLLLAVSGAWLLPVLAALSLWSIRSYSHPRYLVIFSAIFFLWLAYLLSPGRAREGRAEKWALTGARAALLGALLALAGLSLSWYYFHPQIGKKDDTRAAARYLEEVAGPADLILMPYRDRSLLYEYRGETPVQMPALADRAQLWADLEAWTHPAQTVYLLTYTRGSMDWQQVLPFALEAAGSKVLSREFDGMLLHAYRLEEGVAPPAPAAVAAPVERLDLVGAWIEPAVPRGTAVPVALVWQPDLVAPPAHRYGLSLTLQDTDGWSLVQTDEYLIDPAGQPVTLWADEQVTTYHLLPLPAGTPPLSYTVRATVYAATEQGLASFMLAEPDVTLGETQIVLGEVAAYEDPRPVPPLPEPRPMAPGLLLLGAGVDREVVAPGEQIYVRLRWQVTAPEVGAPLPGLTLVQEGGRLSGPSPTPVLARYPPARWRAGEVVTEHRVLGVPPDASGPATVLLSAGENSLSLGQVEIAAVARQREAPVVERPVDVSFGDVARLVGYELEERTVTAGTPVALTLYWRSLATGTERPYTVFTHLVAPDGRLIGQHDGEPAQGRRPLSGWVEGEYITDLHQITFNEQDYAGPARIAVGLYHPESGERLRTPAGDDLFYLPETLEIVSGP